MHANLKYVISKYFLYISAALMANWISQLGKNWYISFVHLARYTIIFYIHIIVYWIQCTCTYIFKIVCKMFGECVLRQRNKIMKINYAVIQIQAIPRKWKPINQVNFCENYNEIPQQV